MRRMTCTRLALAAIAPLLTLAACAGGDDTVGDSGGSLDVPSLPPTSVTVTSGAPSPTAAATATTAPQATVRPATSPPATGAPVTTAQAATTVAVGAPPCDLTTIVSQTQTAIDGVTPGSVRCAGEWASWSGFPDDPMAMDGYFAVAQWSGSVWELRNLGTAGICGDGGVPTELWPALDCVE